MGEVLDILYLTHLKGLEGLIRVGELHTHFINPEHHKSISKGGDHNIDISLADLFLSEHHTQSLPKVIHHRILKHLLKRVLILILQLIELHLLLVLFRIDLFDDAIVLLEIDVELSWGGALGVDAAGVLGLGVVVVLLEQVEGGLDYALDGAVLV